MPYLALAAGTIVVVFIGVVGLIILGKMYSDKIPLKGLINESGEKASFSRFQFLIFTLVIAMCVLVLTLESGEFPEIDLDVLGLLGISGGSFVTSKAIEKSGAP